MTSGTLFDISGEVPRVTPRESSGIDFKAVLNPTQYEAVTTLDGPILVVAGAGSGKTRTLVHRVAYLVENGIPPESILLLTFTRKAASEMISRAELLVGGRCAQVSGGTFHSLAHVLLRKWSTKLGFNSDFGVMDRGDMEELLGRLRKSSKIAEKDNRFPKRSTLATMISKAANKSLQLEELIIKEYVHLSKYGSEIMQLAGQYAAFKKENNLFDFDDLLIFLDRLLNEDESAKTAIAEKYQYIMVDEYQDTNLVQADIIRLLGEKHGNVMVVGDDAQSIYSFRGASFQNIMEFPRIFPGARVIRLEENYRSRQPILDLTNHIISRATEKYDKSLFTRREGGDLPRVLVVSTQMEQSLFICNKVKEYAAQGIAPADMAVLFRAARHSYKLEMELARHDIDFVKYGGRRFLESAHIKDLISILKSIATPKDGLSLTRCLLMLEGVGAKTASKIVGWVDGDREKLKTIGEYPGKGKLREQLQSLGAVFSELSKKESTVPEKVEEAWKYYRPLMEGKYDDHPNRLADIQEFIPLAQGYGSLNRFLAEITLEPPNTTGIHGAGAESTRNRLTLSTIHSAKGLEWKVVFIIWAAEGRIPPTFVMNNPEALEEERRLLYVAATRAEDNLFILCPLEIEFDTGSSVRPRLTRFLEDVPPELVTTDDRDEGLGQDDAIHFSDAVMPDQDMAAEPGSGEVAPGARVNHPVFGLGKVIRLLEGRKARVDFDHFGAKTLHLDYAGLKVV